MFVRKKPPLSEAIRVIVIFGLISMLGDIIYEGARSANGQYLQLMGANAATVGLIAGVGEFLAYSLRLVAGTASDRSGRYWLFIILGYGMLIAVPLMGLFTGWQAVLVLMMAERIGKALRNPSKDTILSQVAEGQVGTGFAFGLQEALDQLGAFLGPLVFTAVFFITGREGLGEYRLGYGLMAVPFVILMLAVFLARRGVHRSGLMEPRETGTKGSDSLSGVFWIYTLFTLLSTLGFAQFALIGYHLKARALFSDGEITLLYSVTMAVDAVAALVIGRIYDRVKLKRGDKRAGLLTLLFVPFATAAIPLLALGSTAAAVIAGLVCYGAVMGAHETIMRSAIADITPLAKRGTGYGIFNAAYGLSLFLGSYLFGALYDQLGVGAIRLVVLVTQALAVGVFFVMKKRIGKGHSA